MKKVTSSRRGITMVEFSILLLCFLVFIPWIASIISQFCTSSAVIVVEDKWIKEESGGRQKYLIASKEGEVFQNTDSLIRSKWNSSDIYGQLKIGKKYSLQLVGWRVPILSWHRNIIKIKGEEDDSVSSSESKEVSVSASFCSKCGEPVEKTDLYCRKCGGKLR